MNMKTSSIFLLLAIYICGLGCTGQMFVLKPEGDQAKINIGDNYEVTGELLAVSDSILYVNVVSGKNSLGMVPGESLIGLDLDRITKITVQGYKNSNWIVPWVLFQVVPPILLGIAASSVEGYTFFEVWAYSSGPAIVTPIIFNSKSNRNPTIRNNSGFSLQELSELKKYVRYPLGLNEGQLNKIASKHGQSGYRVLKYE